LTIDDLRIANRERPLVHAAEAAGLAAGQNRGGKAALVRHFPGRQGYQTERLLSPRCRFAS
jgi:hypothetical protein